MKKVTLKFKPYFYGKKIEYSSSQCFVVVSNELIVGKVISFSDLAISNNFEAECLNPNHYQYIQNKKFVICVGNVLEEIFL